MKRLLQLLSIVILLQSCVIKTVNVYDSKDVEVSLIGSEWRLLENLSPKIK